MARSLYIGERVKMTTASFEFGMIFILGSYFDMIISFLNAAEVFKSLF